MKRTLSIYTLLIVIVGVTTWGCGPSDEEKRIAEQARQDSIAEARADSIEKANKAEADRLRQIELEQKRQEELQAERERKTITYDENGVYTVQIESWRSEDVAEKVLDRWKKRGMDNAFIVRYGNEDSGDIWFRVRLGKYATRAMAEKHAKLILEDFNRKTWITTVDNFAN